MRCCFEVFSRNCQRVRYKCSSGLYCLASQNTVLVTIASCFYTLIILCGLNFSLNQLTLMLIFAWGWILLCFVRWCPRLQVFVLQKLQGCIRLQAMWCFGSGDLPCSIHQPRRFPSIKGFSFIVLHSVNSPYRDSSSITVRLFLVIFNIL